MSQEEMKSEEEQAVAEAAVDVENSVEIDADLAADGTIEGEVAPEDESDAGERDEANEADVHIETAEEVIARLESELNAARAEADASRDQMQRVAAEFQNSKRRQEKQLADAIDRAAERVLKQLLPVLDDFDLAMQNMPQDVSTEEGAWADGFQKIQKKLLTLLENEGVQPIPTAGEFDPNRHEAVSSEPNDEVESGHIIAPLRVGYEYKGRVLRPALVRVAM